jgi:DNA-binding winged helix-turn-helix (wHTH) protein/TolB-like protein/Flp pilus assembly protein TadD
MSQKDKHLYEFGPFRLDATERLLLRDGQPIPLTNKAFDTLLALVENSGHIVEKDNLMQRVWQDTVVEESTLAQNVFRLRRALGEDAGGQQYIETIPKHGYRFVAPVKQLHQESLTSQVEAQIVNEENEQQPVDAEAVPAISQQSFETRGRKSHPRRLNLMAILLAAVGLLVVLVAAILSSRSLRTAKVGTATPVHSIAVLPFRPISAESGDEYLGIGMADTLIIRLSNINQLIVRPISAVRKYSRNDQDPLIAGREQEVETVLEGSLHKTEGKIRVTARLLRVDDGASLWAGSFDQKDEDIFRLQDSIVEKLAAVLTLKLTGEEQKRLTKRYTENSEAYLSYLKGRYHLERRTLRDVEKSIEYFQAAIGIDPQYALAYAGLAEAYPSLSVLGAVPAQEVMPKAKEAVGHALAIDDQIAEAHTSLGLIKTIYDWDWTGAEQNLQHAIELNPNSVVAHRIYGHLLRTTGRLDEALIEFKQALALEPLSLVANRDVGTNLYCARQYDRAIEQFQKTIEIDQNFATVYGFLELAYEAKGLYDQAIAADLKTINLPGENPEMVAALREAYRISGWKNYWRKRLEFAQAQARRSRYVEPYQFVRFYVRLGEKEQAFKWLEKACQERNFWVNFIKIDPQLDTLRSDPRFRDLLVRVGIVP